MFKKSININEGILLVENYESVINTAIHMFFMFFDISVIWINSDFVVVDKKLAKKWAPFYFPQKKAQYILECHPDQLINFEINETVTFNHV